MELQLLAQVVAVVRQMERPIFTAQVAQAVAEQVDIVRLLGTYKLQRL